MADPSIMFQGGNAGDHFAQAFKQGMEDNRATAARNALSVLARDPTNQGALAALAKADPTTAMAYRKQQIEVTKAQLGAHQDNIIKGAQILRQFQPKDQASYSAALQAAQQAGIDISQVPQQYNPAYVDGVVKLADALKPEVGTQDPGIIREFDIATQRGLVPSGTTYQQYVTMRNPGMSAPVTIPYGATVEGGGGQDGMPQVSSPQEAARLPPGTKFLLPDGRIGTVPGGTSGNAGGGFR